MRPKLLIPLLLCAGLLAACAGPPAQGTLLPVETTTTPGAPPTELPPSPTQTEPPATAGASLTPAPEYAPQPGDEAFTRGNLFIEEYGVKPPDGAAAQVLLSLSGNRPSPCHQPRVVVGQPDAANRIPVEAYTVQDPSLACIDVLRPFALEVPLGPLPPGEYTVVINDELKFAFTAE